MKFKMAPNSLFAILLRSSWWWSLLIAVALVAIAHALLPREYAVVGSLSALPFFVIAGVVGWRQLRQPSAKSVAATLDAAAALPWKNFADVLAEGFRRDGYEVTPVKGNGADLRLEKNTRVVLLSARRWKAASHGAEPLRELSAAVKAANADQGYYLALGELTDQGRGQAQSDGVKVLTADDLARLVAGLVPAGQRGR